MKGTIFICLIEWYYKDIPLPWSGFLPFLLESTTQIRCRIIYETSRQSRFDARYRMLGAGALGWPRGMVWAGRREESSGWGTHVYLWRIHFDIWQNQYNIVKFKNKIKLKKKRLIPAKKKNKNKTVCQSDFPHEFPEKLLNFLFITKSLWDVSTEILSPFLSDQFSSVAQLCLPLCNPMDCSTPGFPVHHQLQLTQTHVHWVGDAIQPSHPLEFPSPPTFNLSQWVSSSHQVARVLEFQLQHQPFQWTPRTDLL